MKKVFFLVLILFLTHVSRSQDTGYCKFMRLAFACADTNFALFSDPEKPFSVKPSVLQAGSFVSGELIGLQHMTFVLGTSDASHYPENVRDSMMIATFDYLVKNLHDNCFPELARSMDLIKFNGRNTVFEKEQVISKYLFYFKEIDSGLDFPMVEGLEKTQHLQVSLYQDLEHMNLYHIEYMFVTAKGFEHMSLE